MTTLTEAEIEAVLPDQLAGLGCAGFDDGVSDPDGRALERRAYSDTNLTTRLWVAIASLNPQIPGMSAKGTALRHVIASDHTSLIEENRQQHRAVVEGVPVEFRAGDGGGSGDRVSLIDADDQQNDWLAIRQFTVTENGHNRSSDIGAGKRLHRDLTSIAGLNGVPWAGAYATAKHAVAGLTNS